MAKVTSPPTYPPPRVPWSQRIGQFLGKRYLAALILVANTISIPILAALITVAIYISPYIMPPTMQNGPEIGWVIVLTGLISTLIIWLLGAALCMNSATFERVDAISASSLKRKREILQARFDEMRGASQSPPVQGMHEEMVLKEIEAGLNSLKSMIERDGPIWVLSTGYISAWGQLHDVEEAMMDILPCETLLNEAVYDQLRLKGSKIDDRDTLMDVSKNAIDALSPRHLASPPAVPISDQQAKADLRKVRCTINKFNDDAWAGLVSNRKLLTLTGVLSGLFIYILLFIGVLGQADFTGIIGATLYYIVGVIFGLLNQLVTESQDDNPSVGDYGLSKTRILVIPILSGLAALGGVMVAALLSLTVANLNPTSVPIALQEIYTLHGNLRGLIFAAIFGLGPTYLVGILKKQGDNLQSQINSTSPANQTR